MLTSVVCLIRHGERADQDPAHEWNRNRGSRPKDPPLTPKGLLQAETVGKLLANNKHLYHVVYTSPLKRCLQTAAKIAHQLNLPVKIVVSLAKPCRYFKRCAAAGITPLYADADEATSILQDCHPDVKLLAFEADDGSTCQQTLERLAYQTACDQRTNIYSTASTALVIGHCESQKEMAAFSGWQGRMSTPFCGIATYAVHHNQGSVNSWRVLQSPEQHRHALLATRQ